MVLSENDRMMETAPRSAGVPRRTGCAGGKVFGLRQGRAGSGRRHGRRLHASGRLRNWDHDLQAIARALAQSPYDWTELQRIYLYEVAPVVHENLRMDKASGALSICRVSRKPSRRTCEIRSTGRRRSRTAVRRIRRPGLGAHKTICPRARSAGV